MHDLKGTRFVLVHNSAPQASQTGTINITTRTNKQEIVLPEVCSKSFCWPSSLAHQTLPKQGYKKWGVTGVLPELPAGLKHRVSLYADDVVIFARPEAAELGVVKAILDCFGGACGLVVNYAKSVAAPIRCSMDITEAIPLPLTTQSGSSPVPILGCLSPPRSCARPIFNWSSTNWRAS
jgi:hypothetical protein